MRHFPVLRAGLALALAAAIMPALLSRPGQEAEGPAGQPERCEPEYVWPAGMASDGGYGTGKDREVMAATPGKHHRKAPCDSAQEQYAINGYCWLRTAKQPPCAPLYHHQGHCYAAVGTKPRPDTSIQE